MSDIELDPINRRQESTDSNQEPAEQLGNEALVARGQLDPSFLGKRVVFKGEQEKEIPISADSSFVRCLEGYCRILEIRPDKPGFEQVLLERDDGKIEPWIRPSS